MYVPVAQTHTEAYAPATPTSPTHWVVRASDTGPEPVRQIREEVRTVDPKQPFSTFATMDDVKSGAMANQAFQMTLLTAFRGIGLLLAAAGIYGLIAYSVAQRTREFGIRIALGATRERILRSVVRQGATLAAIGVPSGSSRRSR